MRGLIVLGLTLALTGCAPTLSGANAAGGIITMNGSKSGSFKLANEHCAKEGKKARVTNTDDWGDTLTFDCVN